MGQLRPWLLKVNEMKKTTIAFLAAACAMTGCSTSMLNNDEFRLSGTPEGIRAFSDTISGIGIIAKTDPESLPQNPHSALRVAQEKEATKRVLFQLSPKLNLGQNKEGK